MTHSERLALLLARIEQRLARLPDAGPVESDVLLAELRVDVATVRAMVLPMPEWTEVTRG